MMNLAAKTYKEIFFIDATYKLTDLGIPLYIFMVEDSMGGTECAGAALLVSEDEESQRWMLESFDARNHGLKPTIIMSDKDGTLRKVIKDCYPECKLLICLYHTLKNFKKEVADPAYEMSEGQQLVLKELFQKMAYASTEICYMDQYNQFVRNSSPTFIEYFNNNWHDIRHQWVRGHMFSLHSLYNATNNRLESFNGKLKSVIKFYSPLSDSIEGFFTVLSALRNERDNIAANSFLKQTVTTFSAGSPEYLYQKTLTDYGSNLVLKQLGAVPKMSITNQENNSYQVLSEPHLDVSKDSCNCSFSSSMKLPCRHVFWVRKFEGLSLFDETLYADRWTKQFYRDNHRIFSNSSRTIERSIDLTVQETQKRKILSQNERFREADKICKRVSYLVSMEGMKLFKQKIQLLKKLQSLWEESKEVDIIEVHQTGLLSLL